MTEDVEGERTLKLMDTIIAGATLLHMDILRPSSIQPIPNHAKRVFTGVIFDVYQWQQEGYDGNMRTFERLQRADTACVIPITSEGKILLTLQEQPGRQPFLSLAGGRLEEAEEAIDGAKRELLEETGYASNDWVLLDAVQPDHKIDWVVYTFIARNCRRLADQNLDGAEKIDVRALTFDQFIKIVMEDGLGDPGLKIRVLEAKLDPTKMKELRQLFLG